MRRAAVMLLSGVLGWGLVSFAPGLAEGPAHAEEPAPEQKKPAVDADAVYYGNAANFVKPAEVDADRVYAQIAEYKQIVDDGIEPGTPRYELLMNKASRRFQCAVRKAAKDGGYDLIARTGSVQNVDLVPDATQDVIDRL